MEHVIMIYRENYAFDNHETKYHGFKELYKSSFFIGYRTNSMIFPTAVSVSISDVATSILH